MHKVFFIANNGDVVILNRPSFNTIISRLIAVLLVSETLAGTKV
jgi:hypothetical protein